MSISTSGVNSVSISVFNWPSVSGGSNIRSLQAFTLPSSPKSEGSESSLETTPPDIWLSKIQVKGPPRRLIYIRRRIAVEHVNLKSINLYSYYRCVALGILVEGDPPICPVAGVSSRNTNGYSVIWRQARPLNALRLKTTTLEYAEPAANVVSSLPIDEFLDNQVGHRVCSFPEPTSLLLVRAVTRANQRPNRPGADELRIQ